MIKIKKKKKKKNLFFYFIFHFFLINKINFIYFFLFPIAGVCGIFINELSSIFKLLLYNHYYNFVFKC